MIGFNRLTLSWLCISDDVEVDSFIGQNASVAEHDGEMLQTAAVLDSTSVDGSFSAVTTLPSSGQHFLCHF